MKQILFDSIKMTSEAGDIPIAAVVLKNNEIIGVGYNTVEKNTDITGHAEINAIREAANKLNSWNLSGCVLYSTLEPCKMCKEVIKRARIKKTYYYVNNNKEVRLPAEFLKLNDATMEKEFIAVIKGFFRGIRQK